MSEEIIQDELVSDETAVLVVENGFAQNRPLTQTILQKWLRKIHDINVFVGKPHGYGNIDVIESFASYEDVLEYGLHAALYEIQIK